VIRKKGQHLSRTFRTKSDAKRWADKTEAEMERGQAGLIPEGHRKTLNQAIDRYFAEVLPSKAPGTINAFTGQLDYWKAQLGTLKLSDLSPVQISRCRDELAVANIAAAGKPERYRKPASVNRYLEALGSVLTTTVKQWHWLPASPMQAVAKLKLPRGRTRFLADAERDRLLKACRESKSPELYLAVMIAITTGARKGNIMQLHWEWIDWEHAVANIPKTKNGDPLQMPLVPEVMQLLKDRREAGGAVKLQGLVFPSEVSDRNPVLIEAAWRAAKKRAGIEDFRFHDLRHTAASYLAQNGLSLPQIGHVLGHKSVASTARYAHLVHDDTHALLRETMGRRLGNNGEGE
jgi:integrase